MLQQPSSQRLGKAIPLPAKQFHGYAGKIGTHNSAIYRVAQKSKLLTQYNSLLFLSHPVDAEGIFRINLICAWKSGVKQYSLTQCMEKMGVNSHWPYAFAVYALGVNLGWKNKKIIILEKVPIATHCNLKAADVAPPVILWFNYTIYNAMHQNRPMKFHTVLQEKGGGKKSEIWSRFSTSHPCVIMSPSFPNEAKLAYLTVSELHQRRLANMSCKRAKLNVALAHCRHFFWVLWFLSLKCCLFASFLNIHSATRSLNHISQPVK